MLKEILNIFQTSNTLESSYLELNKLQNSVSNWEQKANEIQTRFDFHLPHYIIDEIIQNEDSKNFVNLHYLINCALANKRISESNAQILRQTYKLSHTI